MTQYLAELSKPIIILVMQTYESRRVSFNFFFQKCIIIVGYILKCWKFFRKPEANENITSWLLKAWQVQNVT